MASFFFSGRMKISSIERLVSVQMSQDALRRPSGKNATAYSRKPVVDVLTGEVS